jgi:hypothetical protein
MKWKTEKTGHNTSDSKQKKKSGRQSEAWELTDKGWALKGSIKDKTPEKECQTQNNPELRDFPVAKKINKGLIQVNGYLRDTKVKFTVEASPEEWTSMMHKYVLSPHLHDLNKDFEEFIDLADYIINPLLYRPTKETKSNYHFVRSLKVCSALVSGLVQKWNSLPESEWPNSFKNIRFHIKNSREFEQEAEEIIKSHTDIAAYCLETLFGSDVLRWNKIKSFFLAENAEITSFRRTYIEDGRNMLQLKKDYNFVYLEEDIINFHVAILCYEKNPDYYKRDPEVLCFLHSISTAATMKDSELPETSKQK